MFVLFATFLSIINFSCWTSGLPNTLVPSITAPLKAIPHVVYSQPVDIGTGTNVNKQFVYAVNHLKHKFSFRNKAALFTKSQRQIHKGSGISVCALKEYWKKAPQAIEELEKEGEVIVTRTVKDGQLRMVFWDEIKPDEEGDGKLVEKEFDELWHSLKVPNDVDLLKQLANEGLQVTNAETLVPKAPGTKKKGKKGGGPRQRQVRITNTHLKGEIDLSKDFVIPGKF
ncbi:hypothetical protein P691DRAFT_792434 [Macrolepiota fuliginosa MF-IS2]|uniref:TFA2 Winged helix domain-containing protein n=1 Tax=Macrolepiota fuliginosa MF-IS2 TaxID=1400762 RepID=A0A9P5WYV6_9AGAR|nr:hypothetical protein P691DRAFT_792434 [Macrolepiota fuliginosa MF-IS2]